MTDDDLYGRAVQATRRVRQWRTLSLLFSVLIAAGLFTAGTLGFAAPWTHDDTSHWWVLGGTAALVVVAVVVNPVAREREELEILKKAKNRVARMWERRNER